MKEKAKYLQLFDQLKRDILQGTFQNGQKLPGENEMALAYNMSRQTVRQALSMLETSSSGGRAAAPMCSGPLPGPSEAGT